MGKIKTAHGEVATPAFMPCATDGALRGILADEAAAIGTRVILCNIYHLYLRPGIETIKNSGGLHKFIGWHKPILTDSGGFQIFSLRPKVSANGVEFSSHINGQRHFLTPEKIIQMQIDIGVDIAMPLDICPASTAPRAQIKRVIWQTNRWLERTVKCYLEIKKSLHHQPLLFAINQGGIYQDLRRESWRQIQEIEKKYHFTFAGIAIGGLAVGESKKDLLKMIDCLDKILSKNRPRYLMGVGESEDIVYAIKRGIDLFDCVLPTRLGRHGVVFIKSSQFDKFAKLNLKKSIYQNDFTPIDNNCLCPTCQQKISRAYLHHLVKSENSLAGRLLSLHNLYFLNQICHS